MLECWWVAGWSRCVTAVIASRKRPVPFRTRKLSSIAPMVLHSGGCGRVGRRRTSSLGVEECLNPLSVFASSTPFFHARKQGIASRAFLGAGHLRQRECPPSALERFERRRPAHLRAVRPGPGPGAPVDSDLGSGRRRTPARTRGRATPTPSACPHHGRTARRAESQESHAVHPAGCPRDR